MATTRRRFINPNTVKHGTTDISSVQSITINKNYTRLAAQGDADVSDTAQWKTNLQVSGTIVLQDPIQADALLDAGSATLTWNGQPEAGGVAKLVTVTGVEFFSLSETNAHNAVDSISLGWNAFSPTGVDPASEALSV